VVLAVNYNLRYSSGHPLVEFDPADRPEAANFLGHPKPLRQPRARIFSRQPTRITSARTNREPDRRGPTERSVGPSHAIIRFKQRAFDRAQLRHGRTARNEFSGWRERGQREADSRNVRVIDFELAFSRLDPMHQQILLLTYRDGIRHHQAAQMIGCSVRMLF
jgi:hypothetical protein